MITEICPTLIPYGGVCHQADRWYDRFSGRLVGDEAQTVIQSGHPSIINNFALPPKTFFVGENSAAVECFGADWAHDAEIMGKPGIPDWEAEARLNQAYYEVMKTDQRQFHFIEETLQCIDGPRDLRWFRTLTPVYLSTNVRLVLCSIDIVRENS